MDLRHLQTFKAIVEEGSFVQAADRLQYAQSTITLQMQQLEDELGVELFDRHRKKIRLTQAGQTLLTHAQHVLNQVEQMQQDLSDLVAGESGYLRVGSIELVASTYLVDVLCAFYAQHPKVRLTIEVLSTIFIHEKVAAGQFDLGISTAPHGSVGLLFEPLWVESMLLLLSPGHLLQERKTIFLRDLQGECILLTNPPCAYRAAIEQAFMAQGMQLSSCIEIGSLSVIKQAVQRGLGIAIVPQMATRSVPAGTVVRRIEDWNLHLPIGLIRKEVPQVQGKAIEAFCGLLRRAVEEDVVRQGGKEMKGTSN